MLRNLQVDALRKTYEKLFMSNDPPGLEDRLALVVSGRSVAQLFLHILLMSFSFVTFH
jgi:hypothetical protein